MESSGTIALCESGFQSRGEGGAASVDPRERPENHIPFRSLANTDLGFEMAQSAKLRHPGPNVASTPEVTARLDALTLRGSIGNC
jgi:hypothetical protein